MPLRSMAVMVALPVSLMVTIVMPMVATMAAAIVIVVVIAWIGNAAGAGARRFSAIRRPAASAAIMVVVEERVVEDRLDREAKALLNRSWYDVIAVQIERLRARQAGSRQ
ncbi:hypothetical protein [Rhizobium sp. Root708]|uniref:hypothetical protein n=1 Tax=Rhizobium sp. Root708 TaxID=1736592 RepID=UPI0012E387DA|nr:hypothetical protein [Rhizobium sp. Root708]